MWPLCYSFIFARKSSMMYFYETWQVWTLGGPVYIEIVLVDLDLFFKVIDPFLCRNSENKYGHNFYFWTNFDQTSQKWTTYLRCQSLWPSFGDLHLLLQVKLDIGVKFCVVATAKTSGGHMGSEMGPLSSQGWSWYRAIVSLGLSLTGFVVLRLVTVGQTDRQNWYHKRRH